MRSQNSCKNGINDFNFAEEQFHILNTHKIIPNQIEDDLSAQEIVYLLLGYLDNYSYYGHWAIEFTDGSLAVYLTHLELWGYIKPGNQIGFRRQKDLGGYIPF